ncbi:MAG: hypothetical protein KDI13_08050 [Alphaproteobacteria bacterium]|nr:hypothetical protein [Alphaproteobacteria bacterium]
MEKENTPPTTDRIPVPFELPPPPTISEMTENLRFAVQYEGLFNDQTLLQRQAEILNTLFTTILDKKICADSKDFGYYTDTTQGWIEVALRIQKQCADTLKARAAIVYMNTIAPPKR